MGRIIVTEHMTLDGVVEDNGGVEGFERGGWQFQFDSGEDGGAFKLQEMRNSTALLLGRVTYDLFARHWPSAQGELADLLNALPKYVVSSTLENPGWNTHVLDGDPVERIAKLTRRVQGDIVVHGSFQLAQTPDRQRPRRRAAPDGVSGRARRRQAAVRADAREQAPPACRIETARPRRRTPRHLPARNQRRTQERGDTPAKLVSCRCSLGRCGAGQSGMRAAPLGLRDGDRERLTVWTRSSTVQAGLAQRARIVLLAADGVAEHRRSRERVGVSPADGDHVARRYEAGGLAGLQDEPRRAGRGRSTTTGSSRRR